MLKVTSSQVTVRRNPVLLGVIISMIIALGLASRKFPLFPAMFEKYPGDALWSMMVYWGCALVKPKASAFRLSVIAFLVSCLDEFSQLIQIPWLNGIRHTTIGHLILGTVFSWEDILAYAVGVLFAAMIDLTLVQNKFAKP